jgi:hypothetical protein
VLAFISDSLPLVRSDFGDSGPLTLHIYSNENDFVGAWTGLHPSEDANRIRQQIINGLDHAPTYQNWWIYSPNFVKPGPPYRGMYHEYFHILQKAGMQREFFIPQGLPWWVAEGSAEYFGVQGPSDRGLVDGGAIRRQYLRDLRRITEPIGAFETQGGSSIASAGSSGNAYTVGFFASEYLVEKYGVDRWMRDYWEALRGSGPTVGQPLGRQQNSTEWSTAFQRVFGLSVAQFYAEFEEHRSTL